MMTRTLTPILAALLLAVAPMVHANTAQAKPKPVAAAPVVAAPVVAAPVVIVEKVVYHINDSANASAAMRNVANHLAASPDAKIAVVTHGKGIDFLLNDARNEKGDLHSAQVAALKAQGVSFRLCNNTLVSRKIDPATVSLEATIVPSGVAEIGRLQAKEGYVYLKP